MKRIIIGLFLLIAAQSIANGQGIIFEKTSWKSVLEKSKKTKKPIFLDLYATWCGPCKQLEKNVYKNKEVAKLMNKNFINVKFDAEKQELKLVEELKIESYPTLIYFNSEGDEMMRFEGYREVDEFIVEAVSAIEESKEVSLISLEKAYNSGNKSPSTLYSYIQKRKNADNERNDNGLILNEYLQSIPKDSISSLKTIKLIWDNLSSISLNDASYSVIKHNLTALNKQFGFYNPVSDNRFLQSINTYIASHEFLRSIHEKNEESINLKIAQLQKYAKINLDWMPDVEAWMYIHLSNFYKENHNEKYCQLTEDFLTQNFPVSKNIIDLKKMYMPLYESYKREALISDSDSTSNIDELKSKAADKRLLLFYSESINNAAWNIYENCTDKSLIKKAEAYAKKSVDIFEDYANLDTYAHILFALGNKKEAVFMQKRAARNANYFDLPDETEKELDKFILETPEEPMLPMSLDKKTLQNHYEKSAYATLMFDFDKMVQFIPDEMFLFTTREALFKEIGQAFNSKELLVQLYNYKNILISKPIFENEIAYSKLKNSYTMSINITKMLEKYDNNKDKMAFIGIIKNNYYMMYGQENCIFNEAAETFIINIIEDSFAIGNLKNENWKFITKDDKLIGILNNAVPVSVQEKLNKIN